MDNNQWQDSQWLNFAQLDKLIPQPRAIVNLRFLHTYLLSMLEDDLPTLIGQKRMDELTVWLTTNPNGGANLETNENEPAPLYRKIVKMLAYGAYAEYVLHGSIQNTTSGLVEKDNQDSSVLTDERRAQLHRYYRDRANAKAAQIAVHLASLANSCQSTGAVVGARFSVSRGRTESLF